MNETQANGTATVENQTSQQESGETLPVTPPATVENESTQEQQQTVPPETQTDETQGSGSSSNSEYVGVKSSELGTYFRDQMNICYYNRELKKGDDIKIDSDGTKFVFSLVDFKLDDPDYTYKLYNQDKSQSWDTGRHHA
jgi:hypothetical protein